MDETYTNVNLNAHATTPEGGGPAEAAKNETAIAVANAIKDAGDDCKVEELHMSAVISIVLNENFSFDLVFVV